MLRVGLISDTHGLLRPEALAFLGGSDHIVHGGDICDAGVLEALATIAPVTAVRGNNDHGSWALRLRETELLRLGEVLAYAIHDLAQLDMEPDAAGVQVVVSGHSHRPSVERKAGVLYVNPGSAGPRRFKLPISVGELIVDGRSVSARVVELGGQDAAPDPGVELTVAPLTPERWADLEAIFNARGCSVARGCWCMYYRRSGSRGPLPTGTTHAQANRAELKALVDAGKPPGLIGYRGKVPVGWVSIGSREEFAKLERSPVMKAVDDQPVWSVICFVVPSPHRGQGVARELLEGAVAYARRHGATLVEAYPVDKVARCSDDSMWFGAKSMYDRAGFEEVARRKPQRPVVRLKLV